ncbi:MAG TPA: hypothetical protein VGH79_10805 [Gaiellaceae bacterium]
MIVYIGLFAIFGLGCVQNKHYLLFVLGIFLPILWIFGGRNEPAPVNDF